MGSALNILDQVLNIGSPLKISDQVMKFQYKHRNIGSASKNIDKLSFVLNIHFINIGLVLKLSEQL